MVAHREGPISFRHVATFNMDEYVGLTREHPDSYYFFMLKHFFIHVDANAKNVNILDGNSPRSTKNAPPTRPRSRLSAASNCCSEALVPMGISRSMSPDRAYLVAPESSP